jgi:putative membrane protein
MKIKNIFKLCAIVLLFTGGTACQNASRNGNGDTDSQHSNVTRKTPRDVTQMSKVDGDGADFMDTAAVGGMMEVDLGKLALEKSGNAQVRKFAAQMVTDHTKANKDLKAIALKLEHLLPAAYPSDVKAHIDEMKKLNGKEFDIHYMDMMVKDHVKTLNLFRSASSLRHEIRDFAEHTLPVLEKHHQMAKEINAALK